MQQSQIRSTLPLHFLSNSHYLQPEKKQQQQQLTMASRIHHHREGVLSNTCRTPCMTPLRVDYPLESWNRQITSITALVPLALKIFVGPIDGEKDASRYT